MVRPLIPALLALAACGQAPSGHHFPALTGRVVDRAGVLTAADEARLAGKAQALDRVTGHQLVVVTVPGLGSRKIEDYARDLGNDWGIGRKGVDDGVLIVVAPTERHVRIAVGKGLETALTDAEAQRIIDRDMLPAFRSGDFAGGIDGGVTDVVHELGGDGA